MVKEELRQRVLASPYGRLFGLYLPQASYTTHPYRRPGHRLDRGAGRRHHRRRARLPRDLLPARTTPHLIVVGNFDEAELDRWVDQYFAPHRRARRGRCRGSTVKEPPRTAPAPSTAYAPNVPLPAVADHLAGAASAATRTPPALKVLDAILSAGQVVAALPQPGLRQADRRRGLQPSPTCRRGGRPVHASAPSLPAARPSTEGEAALLAEVARAARRARRPPPSWPRPRTSWSAGACASARPSTAAASRLGHAIVARRRPQRAPTPRSPTLQAVTAADVQRVARKYLADDQRLIIRYRDESERPRARPPPPPAGPRALTVPPAIRPACARWRPRPARRAAARRRPERPGAARRPCRADAWPTACGSSSRPPATCRWSPPADRGEPAAWADPAALAGVASMTAGLLTAGHRHPQRPADRLASRGAGRVARRRRRPGTAPRSVTSARRRRQAAEAAGASWPTWPINPAFAAEELERQRQQALDGLRGRLQPARLAGRPGRRRRVVYGGTPYGHRSSGTPASLQGLTRADLARFHAAWWRPDNAVLVLTGDITPEQGFALAEKAVRGLARSRPAPLPRRRDPRRAADAAARGGDRPARLRPGGGRSPTLRPSPATTPTTTRCWSPTACWAAATRRG